MNYDIFMETVQARGDFPSRAAAERAIRATFETLAERLAGGTANNLADALPAEVGVYLRRSKNKNPHAFDLDEFYARVSRLEEVDRDTAEQHSRAVMQVVSQMVETSEAADVSAQLPAAFDTLFAEP